ncbi:MAG: DUF4157 domain-containing protein [Cyanobacteriota bacterium]
MAQLRRLQALADGRFAPVAQLAGGPDEEELVLGKFATAQLQPQLQLQLQQAPRTNNTGLPDQLKSGIESLSGLSMDHVRVHYNSSQPAQLNALAYAQGSDIHLAPGQERHLPHEAWHMVQQAQGRVRPTLQAYGAAVNDTPALEAEADAMGSKALHAGMSEEQGGTAQVSRLSMDGLLAYGATVQREKVQTLGGCFEADPYNLTMHNPKEGGKKGIGCHIKLYFRANDTVDCRKIGLTQTTTPTVKKPNSKRETYAAERGKPRAMTEPVEGEAIDQARYLDRTDSHTHPVFGAENPSNNPGLIPESFYSREDQLGAHGLDEFGRVTEDQPAALLDEPGRDWSDGWSVIQSFETTALCLSGPMMGDYLGSVEWGYRYGPGDSGKILPLKKISDGLPSLRFTEAVRAWNRAQIQVGSGKQATVPLPEQERIGTDDALSLPHRAHMLKTIGTLALPSIIHLLADPVFSKHSRQLLWQRLVTLISVDNLSFASGWLDAYHHSELRAQLTQLRDEYAAAHWQPVPWVIDADVRNALAGNETVLGMGALLTEANLWPILVCLNPEKFADGTVSLVDKTEFQMPEKLLNPLGTSL